MYIVLGKSGYIGQAFIRELQRRRLHYLGLSRGDYNITNKGSATAKEIVRLIKDYGVSDKKFSFFKDVDSFSNIVKAPRSNCVLDTSKTESYIKIRSVKAALSESLSRYQYNTLQEND